MKLGYSSWVRGLCGLAMGAVVGLSSLAPWQARASGTYPTDTFTIPQGAYKATFIADRNQVTVMNFSGNFDKQLEGGQFNRAARAEVAREFYRTHPDNYDFLVTFTAFEYETGEAVAFYHGVRNDVRGLGLPLFDHSALYKSKGKLQGMVDMAALSRYKLDSFNADFDFPLSVLAHEVLHRFGSFVRFNDGSGTPSTALLGRDGAHWNFFLDSDASVQYGNEWRANGDGSFTAAGVRRFYSPLDLYLMGFKSAAEVPDFTLLDSDTEAFNAHSIPQKGARINATPVTIGIDDIIAVEGPRIPDATQSQKEFRFAFILLVGANDDFNPADIAKIDMFRKSFIDRFAILTGGRGIAHVYPEALPAAELGQQTGVVPQQGDSIRVQPADVNDALNWLKSRQDAVTGRWQDTTNTQVRDTSVVLRLLREMDSSFNSGGAAADWLENQVPANTDSMARILLAAGSGTHANLSALVARQGTDGGWGLLPNYKGNPLDTALALRALGELNGSADAIAKGVNYLTANRTRDLAWAETVDGSASLVSTALAIQALVAVGQENSPMARDAVTWLAGQQNSDGGFGSPSSSIHETAEVVIAAVKAQLSDRLDIPAALNFISDRQRESGGWEGSVYATAVAARALRSVSLPNLVLQNFTAAELNKRDGERVNLTVTIANDSPLNTEATQLRLYDGDPQQGGAAIGAPRNVPLLNPGTRLTFDFIWDTLNQSGPNTLYAVIDPNNSLTERSRSDNTHTLVYQVAAAPQLADLEVNTAEFLVAPEAPAILPAQLGVSAIVRNLGLTAANAVTVELWQTVAGSDQLVDSTQIDLANRGSTTANFLAELTQPGESRLRVVVDPANQVQEARDDNNTVVKSITTVPSLDLEVLAADIVTTPNPALLYQDTRIAVTVRNRGTLPSPSFNVTVLAGAAGSFETLQATSMTLEAGESKTLELVWRSSRIGDTTLVVNVDEQNLLAEADENNNHASKVIATQQLTGTNLTLNFADLTISPSPVKEGLGANIATVLYNSGTQAIPSVPIAFYDGDPAAGGTQIGQTLIIPEIAAGTSVNLSHVWPQVAGDHKRFIFAVIDPQNTIAEYDENDNRVFLEVAVDRLADLAVSASSIQLDPAFPNLGDTAQVRVLVNNLGKQAAADILVRVFDGDPAAGGMEIGSVYTIPSINGNASGQIQFSHAFLNEGTQELFVQVDPDGEVQENNLGNNSAKKLIAIQDGTFYVNERYISPDGNGTKDSTNYFFRLDGPETVGVEVLDRSGRVVKTFTEEFKNVASGSVLWDGRSDAGSLVNDGEYFFSLTNVAGQRIGNTRVTVDTNRSGLAQALGTRFEHRTNYQCLLNTSNIAFSNDGQFVYFAESGPTDAVPGALNKGLYRANTDGSDTVLISALDPMPGHEVGALKFIFSDDHKRFVILDVENRSGTKNVVRDFRVGIDTALREVAVFPWDETTLNFIPGTHKLVYSHRYYQNGYGTKIFVLNLDDPQPQPVQILQIEPSNSNNPIIDFVRSDSGGGFGVYIHQEGDALVPELLSMRKQFYIVNPDTYELTEVGVRPTAFDWSPNGDSLLVGDAADGGISIYDRHGNKLREFGFGRQYSVPAGHEYVRNVLPAEFRTDKALIGNFDTVAWNPDGLQFAFFFEDFSKGFLFYSAIQASGRVAGGYGVYVDYPSDLSVDIFNPKSYHGIYTVDIGSGVVNKVAEVSPQENHASYYFMYAPDAVEDSDREKNIYGTHITADGLPYLDLYLNSRDHIHGFWRFPDSIFMRSMDWLAGSNAILLNVVHSYDEGNDFPDGLSSAFIVGLDSSVPTRQIFISGDDVRYTGFTRASASGKDLLINSADRFDACPPASYYQFNLKRIGSLLNMTADIRAVRSSAGGGLRLRGSAVDLNLDSYQLDFASVNSLNAWQPVAPSSQEQLVDGDFTTWVPPAPGSYFVRLTVKDLAGNVRQDTTRTSISEGSSITGLYRSPASFSPNGDGILDQARIHFTTLEPVLLQASVLDDEDRVVRTMQRSFSEIGVEESIAWDGRDQNGNLLPDGVYTFQIQNFKFFVTLDRQFPQITNTTKPWHSRSLDRQIVPMLGILRDYTIANDINLGFTVSDNIAIPEVRLEFQPSGSGVWLDTEHSIAERQREKRYEGSTSLNDWMNGQFRVWARDDAGNVATYILPSSLKLDQVSIAGVGINRKPVTDPTQEFAVEVADVGFEQPLQFNSPGILLLADNAQVVLQLAETMPAPLAAIELVYADLQHMNNPISLPVTRFGSIDTCESGAAAQSQRCFIPAEDTVGLADLKDRFAAAWDISSITLDPALSYRVYVRLTDVNGRVVNSNSIAFRGGFVAGFILPVNGSEISLAAKPASEQDFLSIQMMVQSNDDIRYLQTTEYIKLVDDNLRPVSVDNGQMVTFDISEFLPCSRYFLTALIKFKDGRTYTTAPTTIDVPCIKIEWDARPLFEDACNGAPTHRVQAGIRIVTKQSVSDTTELKELLVYWTSADGFQNVIFNENNPEYGLHDFEIDVAGLPVGNLPLTIELTDINDNRILQQASLPVVHSPPTVDLTSPLHEGTYCAKEYVRSSRDRMGNPIEQPVRGLEVQGVLQSAADFAFTVVGNGAHSCGQGATSTVLKTGLFPDAADAGCPQIAYKDKFGQGVTFAGVISNRVANSARAKGVLGIAEFTGSDSATVEIAQYNWSGAKVCKAITVEVDAEVSGLAVVLNTNESVMSAQERVPTYSPNGDGMFDDIRWEYAIGENVALTVKVYRVNWLERTKDGKNIFSTPVFVESIVNNLAVAPGSQEFEWRTADNMADGFYKVEFVTVDGCGLEELREFHVKIDNTPPQIQLTSPGIGQSLGVAVEVVGSVSDLHPFNVDLRYGKADQAFATFATKPYQLNVSNEILGRWNTFGLEGDWVLEARATDALGNSQIFTRAVVLPERVELISSLQADNSLFSPNANGILDVVRIQAVFEANVVADVQVLQNSQVVDTLHTTQAFAPGTSTFIWDGLAANNAPFADGTYQIRVRAAPQAGGGNMHEEFVSIGVDNTYPVINIPDLDGGLFGIADLTAPVVLPGSIVDSNFGTYEVSLVADPSGPTSFSLQSDDRAPIYGLALFTNEVLTEQGVYRLKVETTDLAGNTAQRELDVLYDAVPPVVRITGPAAGVVKRRSTDSLVLNGEIDEDHLRLYKATISAIDGQLSTPVVTEFAAMPPKGAPLATLPLAALPEGKYTVAMEAKDKVGHKSLASLNFNVDDAQPVAEIRKPAANAFVSAAQPIEVVASDIHMKEYILSLSAVRGGTPAFIEELAKGSANIDGRLVYTWSALPPDGEYLLSLKVKDQVDNQALAETRVTVDTQPPAPVSIEELKLDAVAKTVTLDWSASSSADVVGYHIYRGGNRVTAQPITGRRHLDTGITDGKFEYAITAVDRAGLESAKAKQSIVADFTPPLVSIRTPANGAMVSGVISILGTAYSVEDFQSYKVSFGLDANSMTDIGGAALPVQNGLLAQLDASSLTGGQTYHIRVQASDIYGNTTEAATSVVVDNQDPPAPTGLAVTFSSRNANVTWTPVAGNDIAGYLLFCNGELVTATGPVIGDLSPYLLKTASFVHKSLADGIYKYAVSAMDKAGNVGALSAPVSGTLDLRAPKATLTGLYNGYKFENNLLLNATVIDQDVARVEFFFRPSGTTPWQLLHSDLVQPYEYAWNTSGLAYGNYQVRAVATDARNNTDTSPAVLTLTKADLTPPDPVQITSVTVDGGLVNLTWEPSVGAVQYFVGWTTANSSGSNSATGTSYTLQTNEDGTYKFYVQARDAAFNLSAESETVEAVVFTPGVDLPYTPTSVVAHTVQVTTLPDVQVNLTSAGALVSSVRSNGDGLAQVSYTLTQGLNNLELYAVTDAGFVSRKVPMSQALATVPAKVLGVNAAENAQGRVRVTWSPNSETDLLGYKIYRDGAPAAELIGRPSVTFQTTGYTSGLANLADGDSSTSWYGNYYGDWELDIVLPQPMLVSELHLEWEAGEQSSAKEFEVLAFQAGRSVKVAAVQNTVPIVQQEVVLNTPYFTDRLRLRTLKYNGYTPRLSEVSLRTVALRDHVNFFTHAPDSGELVYRVSAVNQYGMEGPLSDPTTFNYGGISLPQTITDLNATDLGNDITLTWSDNSTEAVLYRIYRDGNAIAEKTLGQLLRHTDSDLRNGTYLYKVIAIDENGDAIASSNEAAATVAVAVLPAPVGITAILEGNQNHVRLQWAPAPDSAPVAFRVYRKESAQSQFNLLHETMDLMVLDQTAQIGKSYAYYVVAVDANGNESAPSALVQVAIVDTTVPVQPTIMFPAAGGSSIDSPQARTAITGYAESGSTVRLNHNNAIVMEQLIPPSEKIHSTAADSAGIILSRDGQAAVLYNRSVYLLKTTEFLPQIIPNIKPRHIVWAGEELLVIDSERAQMVLLDPSSGTVRAATNQANIDLLQIRNLLRYDAEDGMLYFVATVNGTNRFNRVKLATGDTYAVNLPQNFYNFFRFSESADGKYLAFYIQNSYGPIEIQMIDMETGAGVTTSVPGIYDYSAPAIPVNWSATGHNFLFSRRDDSGRYEVVEYDLDARQITHLIEHPEMDLFSPRYATDGKIHVSGRGASGNTELLAYDRVTEEFASVYVFGDALHHDIVKLPNGLWLDLGNYSAKIHVPAGLYFFADVALALGSNRFEVTSTDPAGNESDPSAPLHINRIAPNLADLTLETGTYPLFPVQNQEVLVTVTVRNSGRERSAATQLVIVVKDAEGTPIAQQNDIQVPPLGAGETHPVLFKFTATESGEYTIVSRVDPSNLLAESNDSNNETLLEVDVIAEAKPFMRVAINPNAAGRTEFGANQAVSGAATLTNAGPPFSGTIKISVVDAAGYPVEELAVLPVQNLANGAVVSKPYVWNTQSYFAGGYSILASLHNSSGVALSESSAALAIVEDLRFVSSVRLGMPTYAANAKVTITGTIANTGGNAIMGGADVSIIVANVTGDVIHSTTVPVGQILPGATTRFNYDWNTANHQPGDYVVRMVVLPQGSSAAAQASIANFNIIPGAPQLVGEFRGETIVAGKGSGIDLDFVLKNSGNAALGAVTITLDLVNPKSGVSVAQLTRNLALGYLETAEQAWEMGPANIALGQYELQLKSSVTVQGTVYNAALDKIAVQVVDTAAPAVELLEPVAGSLFNSLKKVALVRASDVDSGVASAAMAIGQGAFAAMNPALDRGVGMYLSDLSGLADGPHTLRITATDKAANTSTPLEIAVVVDNTPPSVQYSGVISGRLYKVPVTPVVAVNDANLATVELTLNGNSFTSGQTVVADGDYRLTIIATDGAGNMTSDVALFGIDTVAAQIAIEGVGDGARYNSAVTPVIQVLDPHLANVTITLNNEPYVSGTPVTADGNYVLRVAASDAAGNLSERVVGFRVDRTAPDAPAITAPQNNASFNTNLVTVTGTAEPESVLLLRNTTTGESYSATVSGTGAFSIGNVNLAPGANAFVATVQDSAGNVSGPRSLTLTLAQGSEVEVAHGIAARPKVLIWATDKNTSAHPQCNNGQHANHNSSYAYYDVDLEATIELNQAAYAQAGIEYLLVRSPQAFRQALRTQKYNVVNLINLKDAHALPTHFEGEQGMELRAAVLSGTGLILNFTRAYSFYILRDMMKADVAGETTQNIIDLDGGVFGDNSSPWNLKQTGLKVIMEGANGFGNMNYKYYGCSQPTCNQPAVITNRYGLGDAVLVPFNLPDAGKTQEVKAFIVNLAKYAVPDNLVAQPETRYTLDWNLTGLEDVDHLVINQSLPAGFQYAAVSSGGTVTGSTARWTFNNLATEELWFSALVRTSTSTANATIRTDGYDTVVSSGTHIFDDSLNLNVTRTVAQMQSSLLSMVNSLPTNSSNAWRKTNALQRINQAFALARSNANDSNSAILYMLLAIDDLRNINNSEQVLVLASQIVRSYQSRWAQQF